MDLEERKKLKKNKKKKRLIFRISILLVLVLAVVFVLVSNSKKDNDTHAEGDEAPNFKLQQTNDSVETKEIELSDYKGKGVMINFWATYCKPCVKEMPHMQELYEKYQDKGIEILAINLDGNELVRDRFVDKYDLTYPIAWDKNKEVRELYNILPIPSSIFIDADGKIVKRVDGQLTLEQLEDNFKSIQP